MARQFVTGGFPFGTVINETGTRQIVVAGAVVNETTSTGPPPTGRMKVWDGTAWVVKPVKVWNGSAWVAKPVKFWNGSAWIT